MSSKKKKICLVIERVDFFLSHRKSLYYFLSEKFDVSLITDKRFSKSDSLLEGIKIYQLNTRPPLTRVKDTFLHIKNLIKFLKKIEPDHIFFITMEKSLIGAIANILYKTHKNYFFITGLGQHFFSHNIKSKIITFLAMTIFRINSLRNNSKFIFQNHGDRECFKDLFKSQDNFVIKGSGIDQDTFTRKTSIEDFSIPVFLFCGRLERAKGIFTLLKALDALEGYEEKFKIIFAGEIEEDSILQEKLSRVFLKKNISYVGKVAFSEMNKVYERANILVLPSLGEGLPKVALEAMSMEMPLILSNVSGCKSCVQDGVNGYSHDPLLDEELFICLQKFIVNPSCIKKMGLESRKLFDQYFSNDKIFNQYLLLVEDQ